MAIESVVGKLSTEALGKALMKSDEFAKPASQGSSFKEMLDEIDTGEDYANSLGIDEASQDITATNRMQVLGGEGVAFNPTADVTSLGQPNASEKVLDLLGEVNKGQMQMDSLVNHVLYSGRKFSNQELLVIQAHVFHFAQMTELTVKVAEQGVSSAKAVLNTQIQ